MSSIIKTLMLLKIRAISRLTGSVAKGKCRNWRFRRGKTSNILTDISWRTRLFCSYWSPFWPPYFTFLRRKKIFSTLDIDTVDMATNLASENNSAKFQQIAISFATSNKGKLMIIYENYLFKCNETTISKKYWLCVERECGVYIHAMLIMICQSVMIIIMLQIQIKWISKSYGIKWKNEYYLKLLQLREFRM